MRIGIDIGGVVIGGPGHDTQFFTENFLQTPPVPMMYTSIGGLAREHEIFFISKAYPNTAQKTLRWINHRLFFEKVGVHYSRLVFCKEREDKVAIARLLELDVFIDDREDTIRNMRNSGIWGIVFNDWTNTLIEVERTSAIL